MLLIPLPFLSAIAVRTAAGPRERLLSRGFAFFVAAIALGLGTAGLNRLSPPLRVLLLFVYVSAVVAGFKVIAETTWLRALGGVALTVAIYAAYFGGLYAVFG